MVQERCDLASEKEGKRGLKKKNLESLMNKGYDSSLICSELPGKPYLEYWVQI